jgi:hypothetical protein
MTYRSERELVDHFMSELHGKRSPWALRAVGQEFFYSNGRADVVLVSDTGELIAFEAKLHRWREALNQAYRNTCFAHRSFVVVPPGAARAAVRYEAEFERRGVGLCTFVEGRLAVLHDARCINPVLPWLCASAITAAESVEARATA